MGELVVTRKGELQGDAEGLDRHDGDGSNGRADGEIDERILLAVLGRNFVDHNHGEDDNDGRVEEEALGGKSALAPINGRPVVAQCVYTHRAESHSEGFGRWSEYPHLVAHGGR
jgi:hypothetical protein